jgi:hypothetical protein
VPLNNHLLPLVPCLVLLAAALIGGWLGGLAFGWFVWRLL